MFLLGFTDFFFQDFPGFTALNNSSLLVEPFFFAKVDSLR